MNRKATIQTGVIMYLVLVAVVVAGLAYYIGSYRSGAALEEDFLAKQLARIVNHAEPGMEACIDVTEATRVGIANGLSLRDMIVFNNEERTIRVRLRQGSGTEYSWIKDVDVTESRIELLSGSATTNRVCFEIKDSLGRLAV